MKKNFFWYLPIACFFVACSSSDEVVEKTTDFYHDGDSTLVQRIVLGTGTPVSLTRSLGSIGDLASSANKWNGESLYIFAIEKDSPMIKKHMIIDNQHATAPTNVTTGAISWDGGETKYYPYYGVYDFYGYYADDANTKAASSLIGYGKDSLAVPFKIDGTQDLMSAKATLTLQNKIDMIDGLLNNGKLSSGSTANQYINDKGEFYSTVSAEHKQKILDEYDKCFSSYASRRDVQPTLQFKHLLTRLKFYMIAGEDQAKLHYKDSIKSGDPTDTIAHGGVFIDSIHLASLTEGVVVIRRDSGRVDAVATSIDTLSLMDRTTYGSALGKLRPYQAPVNRYSISTYATQATPIGESMLVVPADKYSARIYTKQELDRYHNIIDPAKRNSVIDWDISLGEGKTFLPGYSYNIYIIVYGAQTIQVMAELTGWNDGGEVKIDPEEF